MLVSIGQQKTQKTSSRLGRLQFLLYYYCRFVRDLLFQYIYIYIYIYFFYFLFVLKKTSAALAALVTIHFRSNTINTLNIGVLKR
jgi:hypothetical protein